VRSGGGSGNKGGIREKASTNPQHSLEFVFVLVGSSRSRFPALDV
jgi:hypothetical protein